MCYYNYILFPLIQLSYYWQSAANPVMMTKIITESMLFLVLSIRISADLILSYSFNLNEAGSPLIHGVSFIDQ